MKRIAVLISGLMIIATACKEHNENKNRHVEFNAATGQGEETKNTVVVIVSLDAVDPSNPTKVDYTVSGGTATNGTDYTVETGTLVIAANTTAAFFNVNIVADNILEGAETIEFKLSNPVNATLGQNDTFTYTILDTGSRNIFLENDQQYAYEDDTVRLLKVMTDLIDPVNDETITYSITPVSATGGGVDYTATTTGTATIRAGKLFGYIDISLVADDLLEENETFTVSISNPNHGTLGRSTTSVVIKDGRHPESLVFWAPLDGNVVDSSRYTNTSVFSNITYGTGHRGSIPVAGVFDDHSTYVKYSNSAALDNVTNVSLSAWVLPVSFYGTGSNPIMTKASSDVNSNGNPEPHFQYHIGMTGDQYWHYQGTVTFAVAVNDQYIAMASPEHTWFPGTWIHVVGTYDGTDLRLYVNGALSTVVNSPGSMGHYGRDLYVGKQELENDTPHQLPGTFDDLRIYSRALTPDEVKVVFHK